MNEEAFDGKRRARKCMRESFDSLLIEIYEKATAMFLITRRNDGGCHLLKLEIWPYLNRVMHDARVMTKLRQHFLAFGGVTDVACLDVDLRFVAGLGGHQGDEGQLVWNRGKKVPESSQEMTVVF